MISFLVGFGTGMIVGKIGPIVILQKIEHFGKEVIFPKVKEMVSKKRGEESPDGSDILNMSVEQKEGEESHD